MTTVTAEIGLGLPVSRLPQPILEVPLTAALWASYNRSFGFSFEDVIWDDSAAMRTVNQFVHFIAPLPNML